MKKELPITIVLHELARIFELEGIAYEVTYCEEALQDLASDPTFEREVREYHAREKPRHWNQVEARMKQKMEASAKAKVVMQDTQGLAFATKPYQVPDHLYAYP